MNMKPFSRLFSAKATVPAVATAQPQAVASDALPGEVDAAIAAAVITVRAFTDTQGALDDARAIIEFQGMPGIKFDKAKLSSFFAAEWPYLDGLQLRRAVRYVENRCIAEARRIGEAHAVIDSSRKRWSASEW